MSRAKWGSLIGSTVSRAGRARPSVSPAGSAGGLKGTAEPASKALVPAVCMNFRRSIRSCRKRCSRE